MLIFSTRSLEGINNFVLPDDIELKLPEGLKLDQDYWHYLVYIPWNEKYLELVPEDFKVLFKFVLPHLRKRSTDIHTAISMSFLDKFISEFSDKYINRRVVAIALILHDSGWSKLSDLEIANSLGVKGLKLNETALGPKEKHAIESEKLARKFLGDVGDKGEFIFNPKLLDAEKELIFKAIRYHDKPEEVSGANEEMPIEVKLLVDLDHLWSFMHKSFWQDTVRKGVTPVKYLENLADDLDSYFVTEQGKLMARKLLAERKIEIDEFKKFQSLHLDS